jgi:hypothetical protein|tara:strand:+ start:532 stop:843 length:312 start_codon:yes stop_codon:yes gene_type:complete
MTHHNSNSGCVCCTRTRVKASWDKCLNQDLSRNQCIEPIKPPTDSVNQPSPHHNSQKFRHAQIVKNPGRTAYGRWSRAKWNKQTKQYTMLNGSGRSICEKGLS